VLNARIFGGGVAGYDQMVMFSPEAPLVQTQLIENTYYDVVLLREGGGGDGSILTHFIL
jgi:hypothetical protein